MTLRGERDRIVSHSKIKRPDEAHYHGGYDEEAPAAAQAKEAK